MTFAFEFLIASEIPDTTRFGRILVKTSPGPKIITSAFSIAKIASGFAVAAGSRCTSFILTVPSCFGISIFGFGGQRSQGHRKSRGGDIEVRLEIDFKEAIFGSEKLIRLNKSVVCSVCHGNGAEPGSKIENCSTCHGSGSVNQVQRTIFGQMQVQTVCPTCQGEGKKITKTCHKCSGNGATKETTELKIKIPAGIDTGESIRLTGQGEAKVQAIFTIEGNVIAGVKVLKGRFDVNDRIEVIRGKRSVGETLLVSVKQRAKVAKEVKKGEEGGLLFEPQLDIQSGDVVKSYSI
jgi:DnaJ-class molecular chaperone